MGYESVKALVDVKNMAKKVSPAYDAQVKVYHKGKNLSSYQKDIQTALNRAAENWNKTVRI
jgi:hypothetical protein